MWRLADISMKYLTGFVLLLLMQNVFAAHCQVDGGPWVDMKTSPLDVHVDLRLDKDAGKVTMSGYSVRCMHDFPGWYPDSNKQYFSTVASGLILGPTVMDYGSGMDILGALLPWPVSAGRYLALHDRLTPVVDLPVKVYFDIPTAPGKYIKIKPGAFLAVVLLFVTYNFDSPQYPAYRMRINLIARNGVDSSPSTCVINNNLPINIDFGSVDAVAIGTSIFNTPYKKDFRLRYSCDGPSVNSPITVKWQATPSAFHTHAIATSKQDAGVILFRPDSSALVGPGGEIRSTITNSSGSTEVSFALVKKPDTFPDAGPFTASGTLTLMLP